MRGISYQRSFKSDNDFLGLLADQATPGLLASMALDKPPPVYRHKKVGSTMVADYEAKWKNAIVNPAKKKSIDSYAAMANERRAWYPALYTIPWQVLAVTHMKECGFRKAHFHNGDPLTARTKQVPKGRIPGVKPPYTFQQSCRDAIEMHAASLGINLAQYKWDVANTLFWLETYNGFGYRGRGINSPYLWSYSNLYTRGYYVADGKFSPTKVAAQPGAAIVLKKLGWVPA